MRLCNKKQIVIWTEAFLAIALFGLILLWQAEATAQRGRGQPQVRYVGADYRDPLELPPALMAPVIPPEEVSVTPEVVVPPPIKVEGVVWGSDRPQAIIDGEVYDKGATVKGAEIMDITRDGVTLLYKNRKFIVRPKIEGRSIGR